MNNLLNVKIEGKKARWNIEKDILTDGSHNVKINKSEKYGVYSTMILHLAPSTMSGVNVCPHASEGCKKVCLTYSGQGQMYKQGKIHESTIHIARVGRTILLKKNPRLFFLKLNAEIAKFLVKCEIRGTKPAIRMNGTSDLPWEKIIDPTTGKSIIDQYPQIQFYDYTKNFARLNKTPENYFLNFSRSESNEDKVILALEQGINVTAVFKKLPETYKGYRVINGDETDLRFLDNKIFKNNTGKGVIVGLSPKGWKAKKDDSGFVITEQEQATLKEVA
jgi:hypothetical protein